MTFVKIEELRAGPDGSRLFSCPAERNDRARSRAARRWLIAADAPRIPGFSGSSRKRAGRRRTGAA
ncbi:MAG TPA: hypothetical protein PLS93_19765, partial [Accumulibacter sp.]|nr:hypothetical protein [Accumulibacter sp.]